MKRFIVFAILISFLLLAFAFDYKEKGFRFSLTSDEMSSVFKNKFPIEMDFAFGKVIMEKPKLSRSISPNKFNVSLDFAILNNNIPKGKKLEGQMIVNSGIRFDSKSKVLYLDHAEIENIEYKDRTMTNYLPPLLNKLIIILVAQTLSSKPIYNPSDDSKIFAKAIKNIIIQNDNVVIIVGI